MQMIEYKLFPTLVGKFEEVLHHSQCDNIIAHIDNTILEKYGAITGDSVSSFVKKESVLNELPAEISLLIRIKLELCITQYISTYGHVPVQIYNNWVSYQYPNTKLKRHTHPGSAISGVLYLRADENSSPLYFYNPNPFATITEIHNKENEFTRESVKFQPKTGDMFIFPSWLAHGSDIEENMSEERIIFSFNTEIIGFKN